MRPADPPDDAHRLLHRGKVRAMRLVRRARHRQGSVRGSPPEGRLDVGVRSTPAHFWLKASGGWRPRAWSRVLAARAGDRHGTQGSARGLASVVVEEAIERRIHIIRGDRMMLDADLAALYGVETKRLNQAVRRNRARFPADFMFQLSAEEARNLRSQFATSSSDGYGGRRYLPTRSRSREWPCSQAS